MLVALVLFGLAACRKSEVWTDHSAHKNAFVTSNGIHLHYLDWGGSGPTLILIPGALDDAHAFDDLAPAFTDHFRVLAYDRRGHGRSEAKAPYDAATLTGDLRGLMDSLGIATAHLAGWSMGGNEITAMAGTHPERVDRIVYLEGAYDWADPASVAALKAFPYEYPAPTSAMKSLDAFREHEMKVWFPSLSDASRVEAYIRDLVVIQPDGTARLAMSNSDVEALLNTLLTDKRDYTKVRSPALAIFAETFFDVRNGDSAQRATNLAWEQKYVTSFRTASKERVRRELSNVEIVNVPGTHMDFFLTSREQVVDAMRRFLSGSAPQR
jgi:pimeloyl-ACP methyl ester carboxylesterase